GGLGGGIQDALPRVEIVYGHGDVGPDLVNAAVVVGAKGIVLAGVGDGNAPQAVIDALAAAVKKGVTVVRSSRTNSGAVARNVEVDDDKLGFVAAQELNPQKSRGLLQLALTKHKDAKTVQALFRQYLPRAPRGSGDRLGDASPWLSSCTRRRSCCTESPRLRRRPGLPLPPASPTQR